MCSCILFCSNIYNWCSQRQGFYICTQLLSKYKYNEYITRTFTHIQYSNLHICIAPNMAFTHIQYNNLHICIAPDMAFTHIQYSNLHCSKYVFHTYTVQQSAYLHCSKYEILLQCYRAMHCHNVGNIKKVNIYVHIIL